MHGTNSTRRHGRHRRRGRGAATCVALASMLATSACGATAVEPRSLEPMAPLDLDADPSPPTRSPAGRSGLAGPPDATDPSDPSDAAGVSPDISAALVVALSELVEHCVEHVQVGAFLGDEVLGEWWESVDGDEESLRESCRQVAATDPWRLEQISDDWRQVQAMLDALPVAEDLDDGT
jgi:hypothetical protein